MHLNDSYWAVLSYGAQFSYGVVWFLVFCKVKFGIFHRFDFGRSWQWKGKRVWESYSWVCSPDSILQADGKFHCISWDQYRSAISFCNQTFLQNTRKHCMYHCWIGTIPLLLPRSTICFQTCKIVAVAWSLSNVTDHHKITVIKNWGCRGVINSGSKFLATTAITTARTA